ncbi:hypothetical protein GCM10009665_17100 [Kitasatospora nipponensis]|uniref:Uncharacterized protein n=1 Tax=Kitasatospora nipponensis TaxID=258049 RepID=A0ABN1W3B0_9ACTN
MLPPRLTWCDPRPVPRFNLQEPVTLVVRDPDFHEPTDEDDCTTVGYFCQSHDGPYRGDACRGGPTHRIALDCGEHGLEAVWPDDRMLMLPEGFTPPLNDEQLAWMRSAEHAP